MSTTVIPCQVCETQIKVHPEDPDSALSDLREHLDTHPMSDDERFQEFIAAQFAARDIPDGS